MELKCFTGNKLTQLDVSQNSLATIPTSSFTHLNHLLILNMNHNKVKAKNYIQNKTQDVIFYIFLHCPVLVFFIYNKISARLTYIAPDGK